MTGYDCSEKAERKRKKAGIDVQKIQDNTIQEIVKICSSSFDPMLFKIDSLPDDDDLEKNLEVRDAILSYIFSQEIIKITEFKVQKPDFLVALDIIEGLKLEGEISAEQARIASDNEALEKVMNKICNMKKELRDFDVKLMNLKDDKAYYDTSDMVDVEKWSVSKGWKASSSISDSFDISSEYPLREADKWDNGRCSWTSYDEKSYSVSGSLCSTLCGLYASVTYRTYKRDKYAEKIRSINNEIPSLEADIRGLKRSIQSEERNSEYSKELKNHNEFIEERRAKRMKLAAAQLSITEANERLKAIMAKRDVE